MPSPRTSQATPTPRATVSLPVLGGGDPVAGKRAIRRSKMGPRRAAVLILIHLVFLGHLLQWRLTGRTLTPIEPSESMKTLEQGAVNAGFIFFMLAILSTLIFGRFFCGWGCHIVALQDLCGWMLKKVGIRPSPFRSRLLMYAPLALALYMFVWPTLKRLVVPALAGVSPGLAAWFGPVSVFPKSGFTDHLFTTDFWETFASVPVAIPFLLVCGFATVYFLGAKGFCTYGCPYGGFFAPADRVAPGRIVVDADKCEGCGHCTAVCTSNVRVHEEVRAYGAVVDPGCMKCMDCVSVCPNDALSFGFAGPAIVTKPKGRAKPKPRHDTTPGEDLVLVTVFVAVFLAFRGQYDLVPMLMAMGLAGIGAYLAWKTMMLARRRDVRIVRMQVKRAGRLTPAGVGAVVVIGAAALLTAHSLAVSQYRWRGNAAFHKLGPDAQTLLETKAAGVPADAAEQARRGAGLLEASLSFGAGGIGLLDNSTARWRAAVLRLMSGEPEKASALLDGISSRDETPAKYVVYHAMLLRSLGHTEEALRLLGSRLERHPGDWEVRDAWAPLVISTAHDGPEQVSREARGALERIPKGDRKARARTTLALGMAQRAGGDPQSALGTIRAAAGIDPDDRTCQETLANALLVDARDPIAAEAVQGRVLAMDESRLDAAVGLGRILAINGKWSEIGGVFDRAGGAGAPAPDAALAQMSLGVELLRLDGDRAVEVIRKGFQRARNDEKVREYAQRVRDQLGLDIAGANRG